MIGNCIAELNLRFPKPFANSYYTIAISYGLGGGRNEHPDVGTQLQAQLTDGKIDRALAD